MIRYLIKNNFKLMFRNKWIILIMILGPILTIAVVSSAFSDLMKKYEDVDEFSIGYKIAEGSVFEQGIAAIEDAGKENGITFLKYQEGDPQEIMESNGLAGFVDFSESDYTIFESADFVGEGIKLEYFLSSVERIFEANVLQTLMPAKEEGQNIPVQKLDFLPAIDSMDYYGIIYIVYFSWWGLVCASNVLSGEKKYGIGRKFEVTAISDLKMFLAKLIPITLVVTVCMIFCMFCTMLLYNIQWGNLLVAIGILLLSFVASSAFGLMLYYILDNVALTVIVSYTSGWILAFLGGTFETYMYSRYPENLKLMSPIYHINRALVENAAMGHSTFTQSCIWYMLLMTVCCSVIALLTQKMRRRVRA